MVDEHSPAVVAFDGSAESQAAIRAAAGLFPARRLVVISVWEPGLAFAASATYDATGMRAPLPSAEEVLLLDDLQHEHATATAEAGAAMARQLGGDAEARAEADRAGISETVAALAEELDACAVVVGSRGRGAVKSKLLGSTSTALLHHAPCPVVVVRGEGR